MKKKVLNWTRKFGTFCFLDNHQYQLEPHSQECLLAAGVRSSMGGEGGLALPLLQEYLDSGRGWLFGHLGYELKDEIEGLHSSHPDRIGFPDLFFFEPEVMVRLSPSWMHIEAEDPGMIYQAILETAADSPGILINEGTRIQGRLSKEEYISVVEKLRRHILRGDCYEINFCQEFFALQADLDPVKLYQQLSSISPNPFSALYRKGEQWLVCASPERFLRREGNRLLSQPIKGTSRRFVADAQADAQSREQLYRSEKDRSENVMVVDLVRNDLSRVCTEGSVKVDELYGVYAFPQVHQMISTVSGELRKGVFFADIIRACFPMGSMTGAPKKKVMELIEKYEPSRRGIFSGALGYIAPGGDFDFNVVIRSILYHAGTGYLSIPVGSGITYYSDPLKEWEECELKIAGMREVLGGTTS